MKQRKRGAQKIDFDEIPCHETGYFIKVFGFLAKLTIIETFKHNKTSLWSKMSCFLNFNCENMSFTYFQVYSIIMIVKKQEHRFKEETL